jgi:hypothetical protein
MRTVFFVTLLGLALPAASHAGAPPGRFTAANGVVTDTVTGLKWQQNIVGTANWTGATAICATLTLSNLTSGWRLPRLAEALTIVDARANGPALDPIFTGSQNGYSHWTGTPGLSGNHYAVSIQYGTIGQQSDGASQMIRCVHD